MYPEATQATVALVLGLLSLVLCPLLGPFAWSTANDEIRRIEEGLRDPTNLPNANLGRILGIVGTILLVVVGLSLSGLFFVHMVP